MSRPQYVAPLTSWARTFLGPEKTAALHGKPVQVIGGGPKGPWTVRVQGRAWERYDVPGSQLWATIEEGLKAVEAQHA